MKTLKQRLAAATSATFDSRKQEIEKQMLSAATEGHSSIGIEISKVSSDIFDWLKSEGLTIETDPMERTPYASFRRHSFKISW